jgi:hypothetical protein
MKTPARFVVLLLPLLLAGCVPKDNSQTQPLAPPIEDAPLPKPSVAPANLPPPVVSVPTPPPAPNPNANAQTQPPPKPPAKHKKPQPLTTQPTQQAATETPVSAPSVSFRRVLPPICASRLQTPSQPPSAA